MASACRLLSSLDFRRLSSQSLSRARTEGRPKSSSSLRCRCSLERTRLKLMLSRSSSLRYCIVLFSSNSVKRLELVSCYVPGVLSRSLACACSLSLSLSLSRARARSLSLSLSIWLSARLVVLECQGRLHLRLRCHASRCGIFPVIDAQWH